MEKDDGDRPRQKQTANNLLELSASLTSYVFVSVIHHLPEGVWNQVFPAMVIGLVPRPLELNVDIFVG